MPPKNLGGNNITIPVIQIKNEVVRCRDLTPAGFSLFVRISFMYRGQPVSIYKENLLKKLGWKNNLKKLKKHLLELYSLNLLKENYDKLPKYKPLILTPFNTVKPGDTCFTQLPTSILTKLDIIEDKGLRLLFYYESFINRKEVPVKWAFPREEKIVEETHISKPIVISNNKNLVKNKLLKIKKHEVSTVYIDDRPQFTKFNNNYLVLIENMS